MSVAPKWWQRRLKIFFHSQLYYFLKENRIARSKIITILLWFEVRTHAQKFVCKGLWYSLYDEYSEEYVYTLLWPSNHTVSKKPIDLETWKGLCFGRQIMIIIECKARCLKSDLEGIRFQPGLTNINDRKTLQLGGQSDIVDARLVWSTESNLKLEVTIHRPISVCLTFYFLLYSSYVLNLWKTINSLAWKWQFYMYVALPVALTLSTPSSPILFSGSNHWFILSPLKLNYDSKMPFHQEN